MPFQSARLRLTLWYTVIMFIITVLFSVVIYGIQMEEVLRSVQKTRYIIGRDFNMIPRPERVVIIDEEALKEARANIINKLVTTNLGILLITAGAAYFLAGRTLHPIEQSLEAQKHFISDASHEIRTPLTAMRTSMDVSLRNPSIEGEAKETLEDSLQEVMRLQKLADSLLNLSLLESAQKTQMQSIPLLSLFNDVMRVILPLAEKKQIEITLPTEDALVKGDATQLTELFIILLENAVKYSPEKSLIYVSLILQRSHVVISIVDQGSGIAEEDLPHIFDRFYRADKSRTSANAGYGLGLAIAKRIVELHAGSIHVTSTLGKGTTFKVVLPSA